MYELKRNLLIAIIILEIITILYLLNLSGLSGRFLKIKPIIVDTPENLYTFDINASRFQYFYENQPNLYINSNNPFFGEFLYSTNWDGLRERYNYTREKPDNVFRIAIFGDSYVYGEHSNIEYIFTEILEDDLNLFYCKNKKVEVINFGVEGYDFPYMVKEFKIKGKYYNSQINIFFVKNDDIQIINEFWIPINEKNMKEMGYPNIHSNNIKEISSYFKAMENTIKEYFYIYDKKFSTDEWRENFIAKPMKILKEDGRESKIVIFTSFINNDYNEFIKKLSYNNSFMFLSLDETMLLKDGVWNNKLSVTPNKDAHPNKAGHKFLANLLYMYLVSNDLIKC